MLTADDIRRANLAVRFLPQDPEDDDTLPCIEIEGIQVYVYFDEAGKLTISAHLDTAEPATLDAAGCVPTRVTLGAGDVFDSDNDAGQPVAGRRR